jgi:hypothetical protein
MNRLDTEIEVITKDGKPQRIEVDGHELPCVTSFQYNADGSINVCLFGNVKFSEEVKTKDSAFEKAARECLIRFSESGGMR